VQNLKVLGRKQEALEILLHRFIDVGFALDIQRAWEVTKTDPELAKVARENKIAPSTARRALDDAGMMMQMHDANRLKSMQILNVTKSMRGSRVNYFACAPHGPLSQHSAVRRLLTGVGEDRPIGPGKRLQRERNGRKRKHFSPNGTTPRIGTAPLFARFQSNVHFSTLSAEIVLPKAYPNRLP
jgi:hypothetical protein